MLNIRQLMAPQRFRFMEREEGGEGGTGGGGGGDDAAALAAAAAAVAAQAEADAAAAVAAAAAAAAKKPTISDAEAKLLKEAMDKKAEIATLKVQLEAFKGIDPTAARAAQAKVAEDERKAAEARGEYDRLVAQMAERHAADLAAAKAAAEAVTASQGALQQQVSDLTIGTSFATSVFVKEDLTLTPNKARVIYGAHFEFKDGAVVGYDRPSGASDRTPLVDASGVPLKFDQALEKLVEADPDRDQLRRSKIKPGAGSGTQPGAKKGAPAGEAPVLTGVDKISAGLRAQKAAAK